MPKVTPEGVQFDSKTINELRRQLGLHCDAMLPGLQFSALMFELVRQRASTRRASRSGILRVERAIKRAEAAIESLSSDAFVEIQCADIEWAAGGGLPALQRALTAARSSVISARQARLPISAGQLLAVAVAKAFANCDLPISKGANGQFAAVLALVWYAVERPTPDDLGPYLQYAADLIVPHRPELSPRLGRPRLKK